mmetsp:Transcript_3070/g.7601  ORF Transcript_3070/g.7601 Transcript_3070/m.7601 type:complete len:214 (-) Transcript_3070:11-652(-)
MQHCVPPAPPEKASGDRCCQHHGRRHRQPSRQRKQYAVVGPLQMPLADGSGCRAAGRRLLRACVPCRGQLRPSHARRIPTGVAELPTPAVALGPQHPGRRRGAGHRAEHVRQHADLVPRRLPGSQRLVLGAARVPRHRHGRRGYGHPASFPSAPSPHRRRLPAAGRLAIAAAQSRAGERAIRQAWLALHSAHPLCLAATLLPHAVIVPSLRSR